MFVAGLVRQDTPITGALQDLAPMQKHRSPRSSRKEDLPTAVDRIGIGAKQMGSPRINVPTKKASCADSVASVTSSTTKADAHSQEGATQQGRSTNAKSRSLRDKPSNPLEVFTLMTLYVAWHLIKFSRYVYKPYCPGMQKNPMQAQRSMYAAPFTGFPENASACCFEGCTIPVLHPNLNSGCDPHRA